ncbi:acyl-CoA N-acyltransferase [Amylocystis lapponica]|nr:acyl-CoA N-acyltransferase [Amylocystis lapponica]
MSFVNHYVPPALQSSVLPDSELYGPDPYDINFAYPLHAEALENERVRVTPFVPAVHAKIYWETIGPLGTDIFRYFSSFHATLPAFLTFVERQYRRQPHEQFFVAIDKTRPDPAHPELGGSLAAILTMMNTVPQDLISEIGFIAVFPAFRHTHVARNMVGLLMRYLLELPSASPPGLGFRRVSWVAHPKNEPSLGLAKAMGFTREGHLRWLRVLPEALGAEGRTPREGDPLGDRKARDSVILSMCWDDWESGGKENVMAKMAK